MALRTDHVYAVKRGNEALGDIVLHGGTDRGRSDTDYHVVTVGMKVGSNVETLGVWDQRKQALKDGVPLSILPASREDMSLPEDSLLVVTLETVGFPFPINGASLDVDLRLLGGRTKGRRALVSVDSQIRDMSTRETVQSLSDQVNTSGLAEKVAHINLQDIAPVVEGTFQGRMQLDSTTQVSIQRYNGNWIEVDGRVGSIGSAGVILTTSTTLLNSVGGVTGSVAASTLYYVYVSCAADGTLTGRFSTTQPTRYRGVYYLGTTAATKAWRYVGMVYSNGSTNFTDSVTAREVVNYYNVLPLSLFTCPAYSDGNTITSYTHTNTTWGKANAGTGSDVTYLDHGERPLEMRAAGVWTTSGLSITGGIAIGVDGTNLGAAQNSTCANYVNVVGERQATMNQLFPKAQTWARHTISLLCVISSGTLTVYADQVRSGSTADPCLTYLAGYCWG